MKRAALLIAMNGGQAVRRGLSTLRGRPYLPGSASSKFPEVLANGRATFPITVQAADVGVTDKATAAECSQAVVSKFDNDINKYGAILYRGFPLHTSEDFAQFYHGLGSFHSMDYAGGAAVRQKVGKGNDVYTASDEPPRVSMDLHNEMAYLPYWPRLILFYCLTPALPGCGGESAISDVREILQKLDKSMVEEFENKGIRYHYNWCDKEEGYYKSWQETFFTDDKSKVEEYLNKHADGFRWNEDKSISLWNTRPAMMNHPKTGEKLWFNHAHRKHGSYWKVHPVFEKLDLPYDKMPSHSYFGDGSDIPEEYIQHIRDASWQSAVGFQLEKGDVMILENQFVQHSRLSFTGERKLLAALLQDE